MQIIINSYLWKSNKLIQYKNKNKKNKKPSI